MKTKNIELAKRYGKKILALRNSMNMSQEKFAKEIGTRQNMLYRWESGDVLISLDYLDKICKAFNISMSYWDDMPQYIHQEQHPKITKKDIQNLGIDLINRIKILEERTGQKAGFSLLL